MELGLFVLISFCSSLDDGRQHRAAAGAAQSCTSLTGLEGGQPAVLVTTGAGRQLMAANGSADLSTILYVVILAHVAQSDATVAGQSLAPATQLNRRLSAVSPQELRDPRARP